MLASLRTLSLISMASLLTACATQSQQQGVGDLPNVVKQGNVAQLLQQADQSKPDQALLLRLSAIDLALRQSNLPLAQRLLDEQKLEQMQPAQQIFASTLRAELDNTRQRPKGALAALQHPSLRFLPELPVSQQVRTRLARATALELDGQLIASARELVALGPLLSPEQATASRETIWRLLATSGEDQLQQIVSSDVELTGWKQLLLLTRTASTPNVQLADISAWMTANAKHPAAVNPPQAIVLLRQAAEKPVKHIGLLLPTQGQLAVPAQALRDGFLAAHYQSSARSDLKVTLFDSNQVTDLDIFYQQAAAAGVELIVGPLEKPLVSQLNRMSRLPLPTLALNYSETPQANTQQLFQFGLAAEDEAREVARRAWADGQRRAVALVPSGDWGNRVLAAFRQEWEARGGVLISAEHVDQPVQLTQQIASLLQLRESETRARSLKTALGTELDAQPVHRQDIDFVFLAATPAQARQIKPALAFQYAGGLPVYATSQLFEGTNDPVRDRDLNGIRFCDTPWMLGTDSSGLRKQVVDQWPAAAGSLGRLYAMGADAYRLAPRLVQLQGAPSLSLDGLTGGLSLNNSQRVTRSLAWAEYRDGQLHRLAPSPKAP